MLTASGPSSPAPCPAQACGAQALTGAEDPKVGVVKTLVVGAGIAGLTLGGLLCRQGRPPVIVERSGSATDGYAIGLYPLGSCVLHGLGAYGKLAERSLVLERYELATGSGRVLQSLDMSVLTGAVGPLLMVSRCDLVDILEACCAAADLRRGVTVSSLTQHGGAVEVEFSDGTSGCFDAVVACDGMSSLTRERVFGPAKGFGTGWALWTWWTAGGGFDPQVAREWCGPGWFFGVYPAPGRVMCAAGGPTVVVGGDDPGPRCGVAWPAWRTGIPPWPRLSATSDRRISGRCPMSAPADGSGDGWRCAATRRPAFYRLRASAPPTRCARRPASPMSSPAPMPSPFLWPWSYTRDGAAASSSATRPSHGASPGQCSSATRSWPGPATASPGVTRPSVPSATSSAARISPSDHAEVLGPPPAVSRR